MKNRFLKLNKFSDSQYFKLWLFLHCAVILFFAATLFSMHGRIKIDADLFNMLPKSFAAQSLVKADETMTSLTAQNVFILVSHEDFETAKKVAGKVYDQLKDSTKFERLSLYQDSASLSEIMDFVYRYRWNLLDEKSVAQIENDGAEEFCQEALAKAFSPFAMMPMENLETDPFMLGEKGLENYFSAAQSSGTAMTFKDGILASRFENRWYVMVRGNLTKEGSALASKKNGISEIYNVCLPMEKEGIRFVFTGTPFHSHKSSNAATKEITLISTVSIAAVVIMLLLVFSSPVPILFSLGSIFVSILTAFIMTISVFHKLHVLTLIFGTSLIGSCIDYSLHYFINWKGNRNLKSGSHIRSFLLSGLTLSLVSTGICFAILLFAPFNLLKQMAVFSLTGIISSFLSVICIYPLIPMPDHERRNVHGKRLVKVPHWYNRKLIGRIAVSAMFVFSIASIAWGWNFCGIKNDLSGLYKMEGRVLDDQIEAIKVLKYSPRGWFVLRADTENELLAMEEKYTKKILEIQPDTGLMCTSSFVPSIEKQKKSLEACSALMEFAHAQYEYLGFENSDPEKLSAELNRAKENFITVESIPEFIRNSISSAWLGKIDGKFYSVIMPSRVDDEDVFRSIAKDDSNIFFVGKMTDISRDLDYLTKMVLKFFSVAYILIFVVLKFFYSWKQTFKIISIPLLIILMVAAVFAIAKIHLEFFSITGIILVFGLGLDYVIYMVEAERRGDTSEYANLEPFAILLSFITTSVSFGALALSSFKPVHLMGLAIFIGLFTAYFTSFFYERGGKQIQ